MKGLYKVGDIVNGKSSAYKCYHLPIEKVGLDYYTIDGLPYLESELEPVNKPWKPGMNVTAKIHTIAAFGSKIANDSITKMMEQ